ncbi:hypothetical protein OG429_04930 [Streptomyces sp. NBC_00190]|uniref:hypothetical protein n=1 Tax=unclassified Streptomyces TaxID=2593676 RepID=UPI002E2849A5|nr:hypothetical protein [Streptomyces sp. NBC_00190]WSZ38729.1 hypothetical protein OG239_07940 [Streptomyces sp. NBC_00868]
MVDTVNSLAARVHELLVALLTHGAATMVPGQDVSSSPAREFRGAPQSVDATAGLHDVVARATALGPDGAWLVAAGHASLSVLAVARGQADQAVFHLDAAVAAGFNDCVVLHAAPIRPLHDDPRFRALYERMRITQADLDEFFWLHQEMQIMSREAETATVDNIGRLDTGVSLLPQAPMPTREPNTPGILITRIDLAATQTALRQAALKLDFQRSSGNTSLSLIDDSWDYPRATRDAWHADELESQRERAAAARAFVERPGAGTMLIPCPPLGSISYPS